MHSRINSYGDSYTNCEMVNDGETWQEVLAARLGEPIRNFGIGAHSVYQMYLRMKQKEARFPAKYVIMNIYCDDPYRSIVPWQRIRVRSWGTNHTGPPQPYIRANPATKEFHEYKNPCPEPKDLYDFCDLEWVHERFKDDFLLRIMLAKMNVEKGTPSESYKDIETLAEEHGLNVKINSPKKLLQTANSIFRSSAIFGSMRLVEKVEEFVKSQGKQILFICSFSTSAVGEKISPGRGPKLPEYRKPGHSFDPAFTRFMKKRGARYVDLLDEHLRDYSRRKVKMLDYLREFWVVPEEGATHYAPAGNQFTASVTRDKLIKMLDPRPPAYLRSMAYEDWDTCVSLDQQL
jgi:hypothetical protein